MSSMTQEILSRSKGHHTGAPDATSTPHGLRRSRHTSMRSAVIEAPGKFSISEQPLPAPGPHQVRVRVLGCGLCGSNLPVWDGLPWLTYPFEPGAPGHEAWGVIDSVGDQVESFHKGMHVTFLSYHAFAEYDIADDNAIVELPGSLASRPCPGEALGCAMNIFNRSDIQPGHHVAIVGIGFLGALLTSLCARKGAKVTAISRRRYALEQASLLSADETLVLGERYEIVNQGSEITHGIMYDRVLEVVGTQTSLDLAGDLIAERGKLIIAGYHQDGPRAVNMQRWNWRGIDVINAHERQKAAYVSGIRSAVKAVSEGTLEPGLLYTDFFQLRQLDQAFNALSTRPDGFMKGFIIP